LPNRPPQKKKNKQGMGRRSDMTSGGHKAVLTPRKMPVGIQDFEDIRSNGYVYVDKTAYIYKLVNQGKPYFLGRPRRFGKSLFLSALKAYFLGKRELFEAIGGQPKLAIADLEKDWVEYPIFHIDLNVENYSSIAGIESGLDANLRPLEEEWGRNPLEKTPSTRFLGLIRRACEKAGKKVAVLIDEYDKPLLETMDSPELNDEARKALKAFYGILKTADPWLRFVLLTGVTKFSQVSIFSDLNQLEDISMEKDYAGICGISAEELTGNFEQELRVLGEENGLTYEETVAEMQKRYNGYHFCENSEGVFNPFSVLNTLKKRRFAYYWFQTGTPTFLVNQLKEAGFDPREFSRGVSIQAQGITDYRANGGSLVPILYQSGYLTIKDYNRQMDEYTLGFPNEEVKYGFLNALLPAYIPQPPCGNDFSVSNFIKDLQKGEVEAFMTRLAAFFASVPYELSDKTERHYQAIFYLLFTLMGQYTQAEVRSSAGRADAVVITHGPQSPETVYCFEFKLSGNGTAEEALRQIDEKGYLIPYAAGGRKLVRVGVEFDPMTRTVGRWVTG
jgi:hypothetical protein